MNSPAIRFYLILAYTTKHATEWHPTESEGPFSVLSRGNFASEGEAHEWAAAKGIHPSTYAIRSFANV